MHGLLDRAKKLLVRPISRWWASCSIRRPADYVYAAALLIATLLILGMGPTLQSYVASFITSNEANIYDTAYKNAIQRFPDYVGWMAVSLDLGVVLPSIAIWASVLASSRARTALVRGYAAAVLAITAADLALLLLQDALTSEQIATCVGSNILGGFIVALIVVLMRAAATYVARFEHRSSATHVIAVALPIVIGLAISGSVFILAKTLYDPAPVEYRASVLPDSWGYFRTKVPLAVADGRNAKSFQMFNQVSVDNGFTWLGMSKPLTLKWASPSAYSLNVYLFEGCGRDTNLPTKFSFPFMKLKDARSLVVQLDEGLSEYSLLSGNHQTLSVQEDVVEKVSIEKGDDGGLKYTLFASNEAAFTHVQIGKKRLFVSGFLLDSKKGHKSDVKARRLEFSVDGEAYSVLFQPNLSSVRSSSRVRCKPLRHRSAGKSSEVGVFSPIASAVFELEPVDGGFLKTSDLGGDRIFAKGANGWLTLSTSTKELSSGHVSSEGKTDFVVLSGKYDELIVAGAAIPTTGVDSLQAFGGMTNVHLNANGVITLSGKANALYWDQDRLNKTRWEKIDGGWATLLVSWLAALLFLTYKGIRASLINDYELGTPL